MRAIIAVADGVTEEENAEEYEGQYREPEPEDPYREQEVDTADAYVSEGKFHRPLRERLHPCEDVYTGVGPRQVDPTKMYCILKKTLMVLQWLRISSRIRFIAL